MEKDCRLGCTTGRFLLYNLGDRLFPKQPPSSFYLMPRSPKSTPSKSFAETKFSQRLAALTFREARDILGPHGAHLLRECEVPDDFNLQTDIHIDEHVFQLMLREYDFFDEDRRREEIVVSIADPPALPRIISPEKKTSGMRKGFLPLSCHCSHCSTPERSGTGCPHIATALLLILEEKTLLGLTEPPDLETPMELLSEEELVRRALFERRQRAETEPFQLETCDESVPWTDYRVLSGISGRTYRVALRGEERGLSYCDCPDFRCNTLGTCKHIEFALRIIRERFTRRQRHKPYRNDAIFIHVLYGEEPTLHLRLPDDPPNVLRLAAKKFLDGPIKDIRGLVKLVARLEQAGFPVTIYPDAEEVLANALFRMSVAEKMAEIRKDPANHPLRTSLLKRELRPYQLDGIAFAVSSGRSVLADEIGLGKTVQAIGVAEMLARTAEIRKVLIVCARSRKSYWKMQLQTFSERNAHIAHGTVHDGPDDSPDKEGESSQNGEETRLHLHEYDQAFFTVCGYEQLLLDRETIERMPWDLIVLDEGERLGDWHSRTAQVVKSLKSPFALVLTDKLMENRLDELYSIVQFVGAGFLPPAFRFFHRHRLVDSRGRPTGYKELAALRKAIEPVMLRRTRSSVLQELPPRSTRVIHVPAKPEQLEIHRTALGTVQRLLGRKRLTELEILRIRKHLLIAQKACDGASLVHGDSMEVSGKLECFAELLDGPLGEKGTEIVVYSEWSGMLDRIAGLLEDRKIDYVRLDTASNDKIRRERVAAFRKKSGKTRCVKGFEASSKQPCFLLATSAAIGRIRLDKTDILVHLDLPWKAEALEHRIKSVHRGDCGKPIQMFLLLSEGMIEEGLFAYDPEEGSVLAAFDPGSEIETLVVEEKSEQFRRHLFEMLKVFESGMKPRKKKTAAFSGTEPVSAERSSGFSETSGCDTYASGGMLQSLRSRMETDEHGGRRLVIDLDAEEVLETLAALLQRRIANS